MEHIEHIESDIYIYILIVHILHMDTSMHMETFGSNKHGKAYIFRITAHTTNVFDCSSTPENELGLR